MENKPVITSRKNKLIQKLKEIASSSDKRKKNGLFFIEGARLCEDAVKSGVQIETTFVTKSANEKYKKYVDVIVRSSEETYLIEEFIAPFLSQTKQSQGVFCLCKLEQVDVGEQHLFGKLILLENLQDPSNFGTVMRTAEALRIETIITAGTCCDVYSPKVLRSSMGAAFRLKILSFATSKEALTALCAKGIQTFAAVPNADSEKLGKILFPEQCAILIGNEGRGLSVEAVSLCDRLLTIPMSGRAESLNLAAAASILMWELMKT